MRLPVCALGLLLCAAPGTAGEVGDAPASDVGAASGCVDARPVTVAVLSSLENAPVAAAMEHAFLKWDCLRVVLVPSRSPTATNDVVVHDLKIVTAPDVDWVVSVVGTPDLPNARLIDPALQEVLVTSIGPPDEVAIDLLAPVSRELTRSRIGGLRLVVVATGVAYKHITVIENALRNLDVVSDVSKVGFANGTVTFEVRSQAPRKAVMDALHELKTPGVPLEMGPVRMRRVELRHVTTAKPATTSPAPAH